MVGMQVFDKSSLVDFLQALLDVAREKGWKDEVCVLESIIESVEKQGNRHYIALTVLISSLLTEAYTTVVLAEAITGVRVEGEKKLELTLKMFRFYLKNLYRLEQILDMIEDEAT